MGKSGGRWKGKISRLGKLGNARMKGKKGGRRGGKGYDNFMAVFGNGYRECNFHSP